MAVMLPAEPQGHSTATWTRTGENPLKISPAPAAFTPVGNLPGLVDDILLITYITIHARFVSGMQGTTKQRESRVLVKKCCGLVPSQKYVNRQPSESE